MIKTEFFKYKHYEDYKGYRAIIRYDGKDNIYWGRVLDIDDIIAFDGKTLKQCIKYFHESIDDYIFNSVYKKMLINNSTNTGININNLI